MKIKTFGLLAVASLVGLAAENASAQQAGKHAAPRLQAQMVVQVVGEVKSIDPDTHRVIIATRDGDVQLARTLRAADAAGIPVGSRVTDMVLQPVTLTPVKQAALQEALPGDKAFVAQVTNVDAATGVIMLKDADSLPIEVRARDPQRARMLPVGTKVKVEVEAAKPKAAQRKS